MLLFEPSSKTTKMTYFRSYLGGNGNFLVLDLLTPRPPLEVKNVKIQEKSEKIRGPPYNIFRPLNQN